MITREQVFEFLLEKQEINGGYTGNDLTILAKQLNVTLRGLRKRLSIWIKNDKEFSQFIYLGKEKPSITLFEFFKIEQELTSNPIQVKKGIYEDIQDQRKLVNQKPLAKSTYYRALKQKVLSMYCSETDNWFKAKLIPFPEDYSIETNRESLHTIFTFSDLKTYGGADINAIYQRLTKAKECFSIYNVKPIRFYPEILSRSRFLKRLLSSIPPNQQFDAQKKPIFEIQALFIIKCTDLLIGELIHKQGRIRQSNSASRQKVENQLRKEALESIRTKFKDIEYSDKIDINTIHECSTVLIDEEILARIALFRRHSHAYMLILEVLNDLTMNMTNGVKFQKDEAKLTYQLATEEITWNNLSKQKKRSIVRKPDLVKAIDQGNMDIVPLLAIGRIIEYIRTKFGHRLKAIKEDLETKKVEFSDNSLEPIVEAIRLALDQHGAIIYQEGPDEDMPIPFTGTDFADHLEILAEQEGVSQYLDFLVMRIRTFLSDTRMKSVVGASDNLTLECWLNNYIGGDEEDNKCVTVLDLSLVPSEVVHVITAVVARMVLEALQRYRKLNRVTLPTVLVMEEAHTFIKRYNEEIENHNGASICCQVFERIAREGRKFGLGLVLSSQRPSELSPTVLSQCNTFLLHRISNDRDQELVHRLVPYNLKGLLRELPYLPSQNAILLGWASELPVLVSSQPYNVSKYAINTPYILTL